MAFIESVGSKVLAGTILEIIKRTGKFLEKDKAFSILQEIEEMISSTLEENDCNRREFGNGNLWGTCICTLYYNQKCRANYPCIS